VDMGVCLGKRNKVVGILVGIVDVEDSMDMQACSTLVEGSRALEGNHPLHSVHSG
jgi:hypothetical protein